MEKQQLSFTNLFFLWFGAAVSVAEILTGGLLAELGLGMGMLANVLGHLVGCVLLVLAGYIGFKEKLPAIRSMRISFGRQGSYLLSGVNVLQLVGWTAVMVLLGGRAVNELAARLWGGELGMVAPIALGALIGLWVYLGIKGFKRVNTVAVSLLLGLTVVMSWVLLSRPLPASPATGGSFAFGFEMALVMPLSWFPLIADYTSLAKDRTAAWLAPMLGYFTGSVWMYGIGLLGSIHTGNPDPAGMMLAANLGLIALAIIGLSTVTTTFLDVWSAAESTLNVASKLPRRLTAVGFAVVGTLVALFFPIEQYEWFLYILGSVFAPLVSILLADYFLFKVDNRDKVLDVVAALSLGLSIAFYYLVKPYPLPCGTLLATVAFAFVLHSGLRVAIRPRTGK